MLIDTRHRTSCILMSKCQEKFKYDMYIKSYFTLCKEISNSTACFHEKRNSEISQLRTGIIINCFILRSNMSTLITFSELTFSLSPFCHMFCPQIREQMSGPEIS